MIWRNWERGPFRYTTDVALRSTARRLKFLPKHLPINSSITLIVHYGRNESPSRYTVLTAFNIDRNANRKQK